MLSREENERLTRVGPGTPMGGLLRRYWMPALFAHQIPKPDCPPVRVKLLGERLVAFRDTEGRIGLIDERCPHRTVSLFFGRNEECGLRCVYHGWKFDVDRQLRRHAVRAAGLGLHAQDQDQVLPVHRARRGGVDLYGPARAQARLPRLRMDAGAGIAPLRQPPHAGMQLAAGRRGRVRHQPPRLPASRHGRTSRPPRPTATRWCRPISAMSPARAATRRRARPTGSSTSC